ncbi:MAG: putative zinc-binding protein [Anaerolineaceae bacterium]
MPELTQKKVGIISCSGEELPEGTVSRLAALKVLEELRPGETVTICLPLFLAGGEGDRAFAKFYPTIAIDGCDKRCAYRATEKYSNTPAAGIVITDFTIEQGLPAPMGCRRLDQNGRALVNEVALKAAETVDALLGKQWSRRQGQFISSEGADVDTEIPSQATCSCGSGIPIQKVVVDGQEMSFVALPLIFQELADNQKSPSEATLDELMSAVRLYNPIAPQQETAVRAVLDEAYIAFWSAGRGQNG